MWIFFKKPYLWWTQYKFLLDWSCMYCSAVLWWFNLFFIVMMLIMSLTRILWLIVFITVQTGFALFCLVYMQFKFSRCKQSSCACFRSKTYMCVASKTETWMWKVIIGVTGFGITMAVIVLVVALLSVRRGTGENFIDLLTYALY